MTDREFLVWLYGKLLTDKAVDKKYLARLIAVARTLPLDQTTEWAEWV